MEIVHRVVVWSSVVVLIRCGLNTPEELRVGRKAIESWRSTKKDAAWPGDRLFGGFAPHIGTYPFTVFIIGMEPGRTWECSGSVLAPQWILSAAHCMGMTEYWYGVIFGGDIDFSTDRVFTKYNIQIRLLQEAYQYVVNDTYTNDIVLFKPFRGFTLERGFVETIPLTDERTYPSNWKKTCTIVGFGLRGRNLRPPVGIQRAASFLMEPGWKCGVPGIRDNGLCTYDVKTKSACTGDSGGPIFCEGQFIQFGLIVGALYENCTHWFCGAPVVWNIHMFVGFYRDWIDYTMHRYSEPRSACHRRRAGPLATLLAGSLLAQLSPPINTHTPL
ncbi:trypsin I-P38-like [Schistocerca gregaria]|uniref:trypsin I-P38-like n=1 Tax=Schistocerca gregaria TaxID=7010 RepID=UPI00211F0DDD|nr:trypsin I-P38-like [Schistocerca gregaria]